MRFFSKLSIPLSRISFDHSFQPNTTTTQPHCNPTDTPRARAAVPSRISAQNISESSFLTFIDNLNIVSTTSPPLQAANLAGGFIEIVPHHWAQIAGTAIQFSAQLGTAGASKARMEIFMREVNEKMFTPHDLKVLIVGYDTVRNSLHIPDTEPVPASLKEVRSDDGRKMRKG